MPKLPEGSYLVASKPWSTWAIYHQKQIQKFVEGHKKSPPSHFQWKVLTIPKDIVYRLMNEVNLKKRCIYSDLTSTAYNALSEEEKQLIYLDVHKVWVIHRIKATEVEEYPNTKKTSYCVFIVTNEHNYSSINLHCLCCVIFNSSNFLVKKAFLIYAYALF